MAAAKPVVAELKKKVPTTSGILYSNPDDTFCGRSHGYLVGPYGVVAICEALDKAGFEIVPKQEAQPCRSAAVAMKRVTSRPLRCDIRPRHTVTRLRLRPVTGLDEPLSSMSR
jgi:hypothetical protein